MIISCIAHSTAKARTRERLGTGGAEVFWNTVVLLV
jgi:hypothetical protein